MITGETKSGFVYAGPESASTTLELLDALVSGARQRCRFERCAEPAAGQET